VNEKKAYIWQLARFLTAHGRVMSGGELADHLNRNGVETSYSTKYSRGRGVYTLINATYKWLAKDLELLSEADTIANAYVNAKGKPAYKTDDGEE